MELRLPDFVILFFSVPQIEKFARWILMTFLPRKNGRKEKIQKLGILLAENILIIARKK